MGTLADPTTYKIAVVHAGFHHSGFVQKFTK